MKLPKGIFPIGTMVDFSGKADDAGSILEGMPTRCIYICSSFKEKGYSIIGHIENKTFYMLGVSDSEIKISSDQGPDTLEQRQKEIIPIHNMAFAKMNYN